MMPRYDIARETQAGTTLQFDTDKLQLCVLCEDKYTVDVPDATLDIMSRFGALCASTKRVYRNRYPEQQNTDVESFQITRSETSM